MALDLENERKYLQGLMSQNNPGLADWAQSRSKELGVSLQAPSAGGQPGAASGSTPNNYMADIAQAFEAMKASGLLGNRGNVSVTPYTPRPTNIPNRQQLTTQAQGEVNPWVQRYTEQTNRTYDDLRQRLPALLNARGQATGGLRNAFEAKLAEQQATAQRDVNLQAQERVAQLADALQQRAEENAYRQQQADWQQYLGGQQLGLQAETMNQQGQQNTFGNLMNLANYGRGAYESDRGFNQGVAESNRAYGLQERNTVAGITGIDPLTLKPTKAAQQIDFNQGMQSFNLMLSLAQGASQQAGTITPQYAALLGQPNLAGQPLASAREAEAEQRRKLEEINATGGWNLKVAQERNTQTTNQPTEADINKLAITMAQKDPYWTYQDPGTDKTPSTPQQRQELINQYTDILKGNPIALPQPAETAAEEVDKPSWYSNIDQSLGGWLPWGAPRNATTPAGSAEQSDPAVSNMIEQALQNGYSDKEIAEALRIEGFNPASYGF